MTTPHKSFKAFGMGTQTWLRIVKAATLLILLTCVGVVIFVWDTYDPHRVAQVKWGRVCSDICQKGVIETGNVARCKACWDRVIEKATLEGHTWASTPNRNTTDSTFSSKRQ